MATTEMTIKVEAERKRQFESLCKSFGINADTAFNMFMQKVVNERKIPFELSAPPDRTREEQKKAKARKYRTQIDIALGDTPEPQRTALRDRIIDDICDLYEVRGFLIAEYFMLRLYKKTYVELEDYLPSKATTVIYERTHKKVKNSFYTGDKYKVYEVFKKYYGREMIQVKKLEDEESFVSFVNKHEKAIIKPIAGSLGVGVHIVDFREVNGNDNLLKKLLEANPKGIVVEELIKQSSYMNSLNPSSVNTLRIITIRTKGQIKTHSFLRVGAKDTIVDNIARGGIVCALNQETGEITDTTCHLGQRYVKHPHTGVPLIGSVVPRLKEALAMAKDLFQMLPQFGYMGWDIAQSEDGWVMVELNARAALSGPQATLNHGLKKTFQELFKERGKSTVFPDFGSKK